MRRTLFYLPHDIAGVPLFGIGWVLLLWLAVNLVFVAIAVRRSGWSGDVLSQLPLTILVSLAIVFLIPNIEETITDPAWILPPVAATSGLPIRGYGVMLLLGVVLGVGLACQRAAKAGLAPDAILNLAFVVVICGIVGARLFFIIQYWSALQAETWAATLRNVVSIDKGGLVVYGSLIGAAVGFILYSRKHQLPVLPLADLIAPSLALGLAVGRIGCLMNGCCFGGACDHAWAVTFPPGSPPYQDQQGWGEFYGFRLAGDTADRPTVSRVDSDGPFADVPVDSQLVAVDGYAVKTIGDARYFLESAGNELSVTTANGKRYTGTIAELPARSRPVHPTQIYSALNALLLGGLMLLVYPYRRKHGQIVALLLTSYAITRFLLEMIRTDEGEFLARLTISQNVSVMIGACMIALWIYVQRQPVLEMEMETQNAARIVR